MEYPDNIDDDTYRKTVGKSRVYNTVRSLEEFRFSPTFDYIENHDVDIWCHKYDKLILVTEVTNWQNTVYLKDDKGESIQTNFKKYDCKKLVIFSFKENYYSNKKCIDKDVNVLIMGFQTNPYYNWFLERGEADYMKPDDSITYLSEKMQLSKCLMEMGLLENDPELR